MAEPQYQRLTRERAPRAFAVAVRTRYSLWLGGDHLLLVECSGFTETYKRFYFRDIQAITIRQTNTRSVRNWILGVMLGLCGFGLVGFAAGQGWGMGGAILLGTALTACGLPLMLNNLFGATCAVQIRTAVQTEDLPSLGRVRQARKVLDRIRPLMAAAQGQLTAGEVSARMQETLLARNPTEPLEPSAPGSVPRGIA